MKFDPKAASLSELRNEILFVEDQMYQCRCADIREYFKKVLKEYRSEYEKKLHRKEEK